MAVSYIYFLWAYFACDLHYIFWIYAWSLCAAYDNMSIVLWLVLIRMSLTTSILLSFITWRCLILLSLSLSLSLSTTTLLYIKVWTGGMLMHVFLDLHEFTLSFSKQLHESWTKQLWMDQNLQFASRTSPFLWAVWVYCFLTVKGMVTMAVSS